ncbi:MAG: hypothetical protein P8010_00535 [Desulfosarcinaceae bacterium]
MDETPAGIGGLYREHLRRCDPPPWTAPMLATLTHSVFSDNETHVRLRRRFDAIARAASPFDEPVDADGAPWVAPRLVVEVGFTEWTAGGRLRHPRYLGLRRDKSPAEVGRESGNRVS